MEFLYEFHYLGEAPFEGGENPELEVVDAHLAVNEVNDFYRERDGGQLNHKQADLIAAENGNHHRSGDDDDKDGVDELCSESWHAADFADDGPDSLFFLLELLKLVLEVFELIFKIVVCVCHHFSSERKRSNRYCTLWSDKDNIGRRIFQGFHNHGDFWAGVRALVRVFCREKLFFGYFEGSFTSWAGDFGRLEVWGDFQFQAAGAGKEYELVDPSHDVADLPHLLLSAYRLFGFFAGVSDFDTFRFFQGRSRHDRPGTDRLAVGVGIILKRRAAGHIP